MGAPARLHRGQDAAALRQLAVEDLGPLGQVRREHVPDRVRGPGDGAQADELPRPRQALLAAPALVPRSSGALLRARASAPRRAQRHAARAAAHAQLRPGRRPHLLHRGPDPGRGVGLHRVRLRDLRRVRVRRHGSSSRPAPRCGSGQTSSGTSARRRCATRSSSATSRTTLNEGDGAFYGPKIDMHMTDSLGRSWQLGTVQLDYNMPERFGLTYTGADNAEHQPVMIHRALMGSYERFIGILLEHTAGELPVWLAPVQAIVLPIADRHNDYAAEVLGRLRRARRARRGRRTHRVGVAQDPRRRVAQDPVHAGRRRPRAGLRASSACASTTAATRARCRSTSSRDADRETRKKSHEALALAAILGLVDPTAPHTARHRLIQRRAFN